MITGVQGPRGPTVAVLVDDGMSPLEFGVACDVFGVEHAGVGARWYDLVVCAARRRVVRTDAGFSVQAGTSLEALARAHTIVVPPIDAEEARPPSAPVLTALTAAHRRGARVISLCTGAFVVAAAGILDGRCVRAPTGPMPRHSPRSTGLSRSMRACRMSMTATC